MADRAPVRVDDANFWCYLENPSDRRIRGPQADMTMTTWTVSADVTIGARRHRGLLIGRYRTRADAEAAFSWLIGLKPALVNPGLQWSEMAEELVSREAWNALTCEYHVHGREVFLFLRMDAPNPTEELG